MKKASYIIFDCETGGLESDKNPIHEIALITLEPNKLSETNRYETFIKPYDDLVTEQIALQTTGLKMVDIEAGLDKRDAVNALINVFKDSMPSTHPMNRPVLIGHNVNFDMGFIDYLFTSCKKSVWDYIHPMQIDTMHLSKMYNPKATSLKLSKCCEEVDVNLIDAHRAMNDVVATTKLFKVYANMLRGGAVDMGTTDIKEQTKSRDTFQFG